MVISKEGLVDSGMSLATAELPTDMVSLRAPACALGHAHI